MSSNNIKKLDEYVTEGNNYQRTNRSYAGLSTGMPKEWKIVRLYDYVNILKGYAFSSRYFNSEKRGLPLIRIRDLGKDETEAYYDGPYEETYLVKKNDILVSMDGEFNVFLWRGPTGLLNQRVCKIWSKDDKILDNLFLYYVLQKPLKLIEAQISQTTVKHLLDRDIKRIKIPLPPIGEQRRIAEVLSTVDEAIRLVDESIARTERLKKGLMQELLTKGIGHKEFKQTEIGKIPKEWKVMKLKDVAEIRRGASPRPKGDPRYFGGVIPWIKISDLSKYKEGIYLTNTDDTVTEEGKKKSVYVEDGFLIVSNSGTIGEPAIVKTGKGGCIHDGFIFVKPKDSKLSKYFLYYFFESKKSELKARAQKGTQGNLNTSIWKSIKISIPPSSEQQKISKVLLTIDEKLKTERKKREKLERIKKALMDLLLTGKVRVKV